MLTFLLTIKLTIVNIYLTDNKKPRNFGRRRGFANCEISMKQNTIPSQTTARLYQHPTVEEQHPSRLATIKANVMDFIIFIVVSFILWVISVAAASWMFGG